MAHGSRTTGSLAAVHIRQPPSLDTTRVQPIFCRRRSRGTQVGVHQVSSEPFVPMKRSSGSANSTLKVVRLPYARVM